MLSRFQDIYTTYTSKDKIELMLVEITANDNWTASNQQMLELSDATHNFETANKVIDHILLKIQAPNYEWKRLLNCLNAIDFLLKNANPNIVGKL